VDIEPPSHSRRRTYIAISVITLILWGLAIYAWNQANYWFGTPENRTIFLSAFALTFAVIPLPYLCYCLLAYLHDRLVRLGAYLKNLPLKSKWSLAYAPVLAEGVSRTPHTLRCGHCGYRNSTTHDFCGRCGQALTATQAEAVGPKFPRGLLIGLSLLGVMAVTAGGTWLLVTKNQAAATTGCSYPAEIPTNLEEEIPAVLEQFWRAMGNPAMTPDEISQTFFAKVATAYFNPGTVKMMRQKPYNAIFANGTKLDVKNLSIQVSIRTDPHPQGFYLSLPLPKGLVAQADGDILQNGTEIGQFQVQLYLEGRQWKLLLLNIINPPDTAQGSSVELVFRWLIEPHLLQYQQVLPYIFVGCPGLLNAILVYVIWRRRRDQTLN
jgi:hypothetical protein